MPPGNRAQQDAREVESLFEYDDVPSSSALSPEDAESLFDYDDVPEPMGPPEAPAPPVAEPDVLDQLLDTASDPDTYMALAQGVTQNYGDEIAEQFDPEYGRMMRAAAEKRPIVHGIGQAIPGVVAGVAAAPGLAAYGPQLARLGQAGVQGALGFASQYGDSHDTGDAVGSGLASAAGGWFGSLAGEMVAGVGGALGAGAKAGAKKLFGKAPPAPLSVADELAAIKAMPPPPPPEPVPMRPPPPRAPPAPEPPPLKMGPPYDPHAGAPFPLSPSAAPPAPARAPYPPAPSMPPPQADGVTRYPPQKKFREWAARQASQSPSEMDDAALDTLLDEFPPPAAPGAPPSGWPPNSNPRVVRNGGRFAERLPMEFSEEAHVPGYDIGAPPPRARPGFESAEAPYETIQQQMMRADGPLGQPGPRPAPSMSEPPVPMGEPPPVPPRTPRFVGDPEFHPPSMPPGDPTRPPAYAMRDVEPIAPPRTPTDFDPVPKYPPPPAPAVAAPKPQQPGMGWRATRAATHLIPKYGAMVRTGMDAWRPTVDAQNPAVTAAGRALGEVGWETGVPALLDRKVNAQDSEKAAYADPATTNYALSAVLSSGTSGLSPADEDVMTRAMVAGNEQAVRAADFRLRMQNPAYARAVERELRSYQEGDY